MKMMPKPTAPVLFFSTDNISSAVLIFLTNLAVANINYTVLEKTLS